MNGCNNERWMVIDRQMDGGMDEVIIGCMDERWMDGWMMGQMKRCLDGEMEWVDR